jgi:hypothetical protein
MMRRVGLLMALGMGVAGSGCRTVAPVDIPAPAPPAAPAPAGFSYGAGKATQEFPAPAAAVQGVIPAAMEDLQIAHIRQRRDGQSQIFQGWTKDSTPAVLTLRPGSGAARVTARIGWFGDEPFSRALFERIGIRLGHLPPKAIPQEPPSAPAPNPFFSRRAVPDAVMLREQSESHLLYRDTAVPMD